MPSELAPYSTEWESLLSELRPRYMPGGISLFQGAAIGDAPVSLLIVGKCPNGWRDSGDPCEHLAGAEYTKDFLRNCLLNYHTAGCGHPQHREANQVRSMFWHFATKLAAELSGAGGCPYDHLAWTNLAKIVPEPTGNAKGGLWREQRSLAVRTLRAEVEHYRPHLVVCTTLAYFNDAVLEAFGLAGAGAFEAGEQCMWTRGCAACPPVLITKHPQRKTRATVDAWLSKAQELASGR